jgi:hypothetical protein
VIDEGRVVLLLSQFNRISTVVVVVCVLFEEVVSVSVCLWCWWLWTCGSAVCVSARV